MVSHLSNQQKSKSFGTYFFGESVQKLINGTLINDREDCKIAQPLEEVFDNI